MSLQDDMAKDLAALMRDENLKNFVATKLRDGDARMGKIEESVADLSKEVEEMKGDIKSVIELLEIIRGSVKVLGVFGFMIKWAAGVATAVGILMALFGKIPWPWK